MRPCNRCGKSSPQDFYYNTIKGEKRQIQPCKVCRKKLYYHGRPRGDLLSKYDKIRRMKFARKDRYVLAYDPDDSMPVGASFSQEEIDADLENGNYFDGTMFVKDKRRFVVKENELARDK